MFVDKQENADDLVKNLLKNSYTAMALHGGVDQCDRESIMGFFKSANMPLLVATSIAARGLDVKDLILVVNYDCPNHYEDYVHRCGYRFTISFFVLYSRVYIIFYYILKAELVALVTRAMLTRSLHPSKSDMPVT